MIRLFLTGSLLVAFASPPVAAEEGFAPMLDGKTPSGWTRAGGTASYRVEGHEVIGVVAPASVDALKRAWIGGVRDEARLAWLHALDAAK